MERSRNLIGFVFDGLIFMTKKCAKNVQIFFVKWLFFALCSMDWQREKFEAVLYARK